MERSSLTRLNDFCKYVLLQKCAYLEQLLHNHAEIEISDWEEHFRPFSVGCFVYPFKLGVPSGDYEQPAKVRTSKLRQQRKVSILKL